MYGFPPLQLTMVNITNNTDTTINDISFNYEGSMSEDVVIPTLKPRQNKHTGISTINLKNHTDIMMYNKANEERFSYALKPDAINPGVAVKYSGVLHVRINDVKDNGELQLSVTIEE